MKKLAKLTSLLLAGIMALALLTACNGTPAPPKPKHWASSIPHRHLPS